MKLLYKKAISAHKVAEVSEQKDGSYFVAIVQHYDHYDPDYPTGQVLDAKTCKRISTVNKFIQYWS